MLNIWHVVVQTLINHSRLRIYLKPVLVWSLIPNSSTDRLCNAVVSDILRTQLCTQCTVHLWLNHIPLQSDPYEPAHLIESPVGCQRDIDNITSHPCPHTITPSADLRLHGQQSQPGCLLPLHTAAGESTWWISLHGETQGQGSLWASPTDIYNSPTVRTPVASGFHHITNPGPWLQTQGKLFWII